MFLRFTYLLLIIYIYLPQLEGYELLMSMTQKYWFRSGTGVASQSGNYKKTNCLVAVYLIMFYKSSVFSFTLFIFIKFLETKKP